MSHLILGIESSCDDTSAAVIRDEYLLSNVMASQEVHRNYGGVIPELASRAHQQNILPVVDQALKNAGVTMKDIDAIAFTRGPGLLGSLLVGTSFAKGLSISTGKPLVEVNHLQGHILSHFLKEEGKENRSPEFPFLALLVSGGHTQIVKVTDYLNFEVIGHTIDDAVGEAFDKCAKMMGLGYPGGPIVDKLAKEGDENRFKFSKPHIQGLDYSFSGIKTSLLYFLRDQLKENENFIEENKADICASFQKHLIDILLDKLIKAVKQTGIKHVAVAGGVSANNGLRNAFHDHAKRFGWTIYIPKFSYTTDNAAMIGIVGTYKYENKEFCPIDTPTFSKVTFN
ncbi:MAG: tRNA (adenosine(37)-N6)-threonylcarbamoyltransferase complex transferase subunit TsaD [Bacteroidales bacterium]|nr:tRNA (adenosine(37)-N6)-threonylcarbamoyltransferase complex transferase subunit TsaD [Bacteroidales bacterium]